MAKRFKITVTVDVSNLDQEIDTFNEYLVRQLGPNPGKEPGDPDLEFISLDTLANVMKRTLVTSSSLLSVGYDRTARILEVEFRGGGIYQYYEVPAQIYESLMSAESIGKFFASQIRTTYEYVKVAGAPAASKVSKNQAKLPFGDDPPRTDDDTD